jgi:hypothetical protein
MNMPPVPMSVTDWIQVAPSRHPGDTGFALWRTQNFGDIRVRMVEYSPGYVADHWCAKGHVILCLTGAIDIELRDGKRLALKQGESYHVGDGDPPHRTSTTDGATLFIVD